MRRIMVGFSLLVSCCVTPAVAAESELQKQFQLYLKSPAEWRGDEELTLQTALKSTEPKIRELAEERLKELGKDKPRKGARPKVVKSRISRLADATLVHLWILDLELARQESLNRLELTAEQVQLILKTGKTEKLPPVVVAAELRLPVLKRIRQQIVLDFYQETLDQQKSSIHKLAVLQQFDKAAESRPARVQGRLAALRSRQLATLQSDDRIAEFRFFVSNSLKPVIPYELAREFNLPRDVQTRLLRKMLDDKDSRVRALARLRMIERGTDDDCLVASLSGIVLDSDSRHVKLGDLLERVRPEHRYAKAYLTRLYKNPNVDVRSDVLAAVERTKRNDRSTQILLRDSLSNGDVHIRVHAQMAMRNLGVLNVILKDDLIPGLKSRNVAEVQQAAHKLQSLGRAARPAQQPLEKLLTHADEGVRYRAAAAVQRVRRRRPLSAAADQGDRCDSCLDPPRCNPAARSLPPGPGDRRPRAAEASQRHRPASRRGGGGCARAIVGEVIETSCKTRRWAKTRLVFGQLAA